MVGLVVVNGAAVESDGATEAIDQIVRMGDLLIQRGSVSDELECRARLIDIADGVVLEKRWGGVAELVGIECGTDGEGEDLAGVDVLHDNGAIVGVRLLHIVVESALGHELDVFIDGELEILAGLRILCVGADHLAAGIHGGKHAAGGAVKFGVEFAFYASEAVIVQTDVAEDLSGNLSVGIEALEFFLEVDVLHIEGVQLLRDFG